MKQANNTTGGMVMENIGCLVIVDGILKKTAIPKEFIGIIAENLREHGKTEIAYIDRVVEIEGIFIPAKGVNYTVMVLPMDEE